MCDVRRKKDALLLHVCSRKASLFLHILHTFLWSLAWVYFSIQYRFYVFLAFISVKDLHVKIHTATKKKCYEWNYAVWNEWDLLNGTMDRKTQNQKIVWYFFINEFVFFTSVQWICYRDALYAWSFIELSDEIIEMLSYRYTE